MDKDLLKVTSKVYDKPAIKEILTPLFNHRLVLLYLNNY